MAQILAVHHEADSLALIARVLSGNGHEVISYKGFREAALWLQSHTPDLVVMSGGRHGEKAREAVKTLKAAGTSRSGILLLMSVASPASTRESLKREVRTIMEETTDYEELLNSVESALSKKG